MYNDSLSSNVSQHSYVITFAWMTIGLLISAITSFVVLATGFVYTLLSSHFVLILLWIAQFAIVIGFSSMMHKSDANGLKGLFILYAFTLGISLTPTFLVFGLGIVTMAFIVSAIYFGCLALIGLTTKKDVSRIGTICVGALVALIITQLLLMIFHVDAFSRIICFIGLLLFTGITIWDMSRVKQLLYMSNGNPVQTECISIYMALQLYLDFINIFLYVIRILGIRRNNN
ncbi:Bax inhibitor-1/YccA family protein [Floccifex sp.]|uniref:Bax inhibitor-1/YccA family protein n=1 Tax=Floccifex sp. TaxID=2815810 RepID=UPI003F03C06F